MTAIATLPVLAQTGTHAARPAASAVGSGALYSCTTHNLIYQQLAGSWGTWYTPPSAAVALTNNVKVDSSGNHNVTSTTDAAVDTTNLRLSLTTTASGVALVIFSTTARANSSATAKFSFRLDGAASVGGSQGILLHAVGSATAISYHWLFTGLSAAAHTFDVSAWVDTGSVDIGFSSSNRSVITGIQIA